MSDFEERARVRARLLFEAHRAAPYVDVLDTETDAQIRRNVVLAVMGPAWVEGRCDDYVLGAFQVIVEEHRTAPPPLPEDLIGTSLH